VNENNKDVKFMNLKNILIILGISLGASLAYNFGKSIFGTNMTILATIETFVFLILVQFLCQFFIYRNHNKKK
jgi:hypothetical protein